MKTTKAIVIVEQDAEDVMVYALNPIDDPEFKLKEMWQSDLNTEIKESTRTVNTDKSFCKDGYAEIWYATGTTPIKYFVTDIR